MVYLEGMMIWLAEAIFRISWVPEIRLYSFDDWKDASSLLGGWLTLPAYNYEGVLQKFSWKWFHYKQTFK